MSVILHFWRYEAERSEEFPTVTEAIAVALKWKHAEECWGIASAVSKDGVDLFPGMKEPEQWACAWDRQANLGATLFKERLTQSASAKLAGATCALCDKPVNPCAAEVGATGLLYHLHCYREVTNEGRP